MTFILGLLGSWEEMISSDVAKSRLAMILVDWTFCCCMRISPLLVASDLARCLVMRVMVRPGQDSKWPHWMAWRKVEDSGLNAQACRKAVRSRLVLTFLIAPFAECWVCDVCVSFGARGTFQRPLTSLRCPTIITFPFL